MSKLTEKLSKVKKSTWITAGTFAAAGILIATAAIGGSQAVLTYFSDDYTAQVEMFNIGVSLLEESVNDTEAHVVAYRNYVADSNGVWSVGTTSLMENLLSSEDDYIVIGQPYKEVLSVQNSGTTEDAINEYVRVKVYKYWTDAEDNKVTVLSPNLIDLKYVTDNGWVIGSQTDECTVLYYTPLLEAGAVSAPFTESVTVYIDDSITYDVIKTTSDDGRIIRYTYKYDQYKFHIECEVDAVQEHNAADAMMSAWGVNPFAEQED